MSEVYYFNLSSQDNQILTPKTGVAKLKVRTYQAIEKKREIVFWFDRDDVANPADLVNPGIRMSVTFLEEVSPNKFLIKDYDNREYNLELLYVE